MKKFKTEIICIIMLGISTLCGIQFKDNQEESAAKAFHGGYYITLMHQQGLAVAINKVNEAITTASSVEERNALMQMRRVLPMLEEK